MTESQSDQQGPSQDERTMGMLCHLSALIGFIGPLIVWLLKKDESEFVNDQGKESLNFQLSILIYTVAAFVLAVPLTLILIGPLLPFAVWAFDIVMFIIAAVQANNGVRYRYPLCIRFVK